MTSWVIGRGGLLGSSVERQLDLCGVTWTPLHPLQWTNHQAFVESLSVAADEFFTVVGEGAWSILWCAGIGVVSSNESVLDQEIQKIRSLLDILAKLAPKNLHRGVLFYASSAGGVYAGSTGPPFDEHTAARPLANYGAQKLVCEQLFVEFARLTGVRVGVGRIANLYGPRQNQKKSQGIVTAICKAMLFHQPIEIYVPLETVRNYVYVDDVGIIVASFVMQLGTTSPGSIMTKVVASDRNCSISFLLHECKQVFGRHPKIVLSRSSIEGLHSRDLRLCSKVLPELDRFTFTPVPVGISRVRRQLEIELQSGAAH